MARAIKRSRDTGEITEYFMLITEPHCKGHEKGASQTVKAYMEEQGLAIYNDMNDKLMDIISLKNQIMPGPLDPKSGNLFYLASYDLDSFRTQIFEQNLLGNLKLNNKLLDKIKTSDEALLNFGYGWIKHKLFGMGIKKE